MIATHYGLKHPISKYRELTKTDHNGANLYGLCDAAEKIGLKAEALQGNVDELLSGIHSGDISFPFIAHIITEDALQHFVVVVAIKNGVFIVGDPAKGKVRYTVEQFSALWNGYIVTFQKTAFFKQGNYNKGSLRKFFSLLKGQYTKLVAVMVLSLIISLIGIVGALVFEIIIDDFYLANEVIVCEDDCEEDHTHTIQQDVEGDMTVLDRAVNFIINNASDFNLFFVCLIGLYILQAAIQFLRGYLISTVSKKIDIRLLLPYYDHIIDLPMSAVNTRNTGEYLSRFSDASAVRDAISGATLTLLLDSVMVIGCGIILYLENAILFYISLLIIILYTVIILCYRKPLENINREVMENNARVQSFLKESIDGVETLKSHQAETMAKNKNSKKFLRLIGAVFKDNILSVSQDSLCDLIELIGIVIILWVGFGMVLAGAVSIGSLITFYALLAYFTEPIKNLIGLQPLMQTAIVAAKRLHDILDIPTENREQTSLTTLAWNTISFSGVDFRYGNRELLLKNIHLNINKGQRIAIVGESGCGKTTLVKLLLKFYEAERGEITIDGNDLRCLSTEIIRKGIAYIDQNPFLFSDTINNNLRLGNPSATDEEILSVCKATRADEFIQNLPFGYDTLLEENGKNLSGGQKQRLAIARALLRNPNVLIFDEATSHLDTITEAAIKDTIFRLDRSLTCIIIAHRLSTVKNCDKIIVMSRGKIVEIGTHQELIDQHGIYFDLCNGQ